MSDALLAPESLEGEVRTALQRFVLTLADSKRMMGVRYSDWLLGSPSIETGIALSSMAQDEWGHARLIYALLKALDLDPVEIEHGRPGEEYASVDALDEAFPTWPAVVSGMVVIDGALTVALDSFANGTYEPAVSRVPKMLAEEAFHESLGAAWFKRLAGASDEARGLLVEAAEAALPPVLAWLGAADGPQQALAGAGIVDAGPKLVSAFGARAGELLGVAGIDLSAHAAASGWDEARGRGPGRPDEDAVQRMRGDLNRALFVE